MGGRWDPRACGLRLMLRPSGLPGPSHPVLGNECWGQVRSRDICRCPPPSVLQYLYSYASFPPLVSLPPPRPDPCPQAPAVATPPPPAPAAPSPPSQPHPGDLAQALPSPLPSPPCFVFPSLSLPLCPQSFLATRRPVSACEPLPCPPPRPAPSPERTREAMRFGPAPAPLSPLCGRCCGAKPNPSSSSIHYAVPKFHPLSSTGLVQSSGAFRPKASLVRRS